MMSYNSDGGHGQIEVDQTIYKLDRWTRVYRRVLGGVDRRAAGASRVGGTVT